MIIRTHALALQIRPWSKTSHMVTWLTPDYGKIVTAVKGACRPKSAFLGQYDLFYTCDLLFYRREYGGVHAIRECVPTTLREPLRHNWRQAVAAAYLADLTAQAIAGQQDASAVFSLLTLALDGLSLGLLPDFNLCPLCHTPDRTWLRFSLSAGRFLCPHLARHQPGEATITLHRRVQPLFQHFCQMPSPPSGDHVPAALASKKYGPETNLLLGLSRFLGIFITFHLDVPSAVRRVTFELLNANHTQKSALLENCSS